MLKCRPIDFCRRTEFFLHNNEGNTFATVTSQGRGLPGGPIVSVIVSDTDPASMRIVEDDDGGNNTTATTTTTTTNTVCPIDTPASSFFKNPTTLSGANQLDGYIYSYLYAYGLIMSLLVRRLFWSLVSGRRWMISSLILGRDGTSNTSTTTTDTIAAATGGTNPPSVPRIIFFERFVLVSVRDR